MSRYSIYDLHPVGAGTPLAGQVYTKNATDGLWLPDYLRKDFSRKLSDNLRLGDSAAATTSAADADWLARSTAAGVIYANSFNSSSDLTLGGANGVQTAGDGTTQGSIDPTHRRSGSNSLRFKFRSGVADTNIAGSWEIRNQFSFAAGNHRYIQWAQYVDANWITAAMNRWQSSCKQFQMMGAGATCQNTEYTAILQPDNPGVMPEMYSTCNGDGLETSTSSTNQIFSCPGDCLLQQGSSFTDGPGVGYNCHYQNKIVGDGNGNGCFVLSAATWVTFYLDILFGTQGSGGTTVNGYISIGGTPYLQYIRVTNVEWPSGGDSTFAWFRLETYMTELNLAATTDCYMWYDELIISSQPIVAPSSLPIA